jgi:hypothetical protein
MRPRTGFASIFALMVCAACSSTARQQTDTVRSDSTANATSADSLAWAVDAHGIGRVRVGATLASLSKLLHEPLHASYSYNETCDYVRPRALPVGVKLMVTGDTVVRIDVDSGTTTTTNGAGIGMAEARVLTIYRGRVSVQPHPYTGPVGHYLIVSARNDTIYRMIFETDGKIVKRYRGGRRPEVDFKEGCS